MKLPRFRLPERKRFLALVKDVAEKGVVLLFIGYIAFSVGRSVTKNYAVNQKIDDLKEQIDLLEQEKLYLENLIAYYKTDTFKELKAREELGLQKPGEHVLAVPVEEEDRPEDFKLAQFGPPPKEEKPIPNYQKWYQYFLGS